MTDSIPTLHAQTATEPAAEKPATSEQVPPATTPTPSHPGGHPDANERPASGTPASGHSDNRDRRDSRPPRQNRERRPEGAGQGERRPREGAASGNRPPRDPNAPRTLREENTIFIGRKSTMGYVLAVVTQFQSGAPHVKIKARGKIISMAVDVAEIVRHKFLPDVKVQDISIQTEDVENEDGSRSKVSSIQITLSK